MGERTGPWGPSAPYAAPEEASNPKRAMGSYRAEACGNGGCLSAAPVRGAERALALLQGAGCVRAASRHSSPSESRVKGRHCRRGENQM